MADAGGNRALPVPQIVEEEDDPLRLARRIANFLDGNPRGKDGKRRFSLGWDPVIGFLIPVAGDIIISLCLLAYYHYLAQSLGLGLWDRVKLTLRLVADTGVGIVFPTIPAAIAGEVFDAVSRPNRKIVDMFDQHIQRLRWASEVERRRQALTGTAQTTVGSGTTPEGFILSEPSPEQPQLPPHLEPPPDDPAT